MAEVAQARKGHALKSLSSDENLNPKIRDFVAILICVAYFKAFIELSIQEYQKQCFPCIYKYKVFCCNFGNARKNDIFCRKLANMRPTKELKAFFAFTESLPTSATLPGA